MVAEFSIDDDGTMWLLNATDIVTAVNKTNINATNRTVFSKKQAVQEKKEENTIEDPLLVFGKVR